MPSRTPRLEKKYLVGTLLLLLVVSVTRAAAAAEPVALRVENFTVPPATGPLAYVVVKNLLEQPYSGVVSLTGPEGWQIAPTEREIQLAAGQTTRVPFAIDKARTTAGHLYSCEARATGGGTTVSQRREVAVASTPYFKPTIDGDPSEWSDAIPLQFTTAGKKTVVSTFWNRRSFSLLVAVDDDTLTRRDPARPDQPCDAVQIALAPAKAKTPTSPKEAAQRYEFLLCAGGGDQAACYRLAEPGTPLQATQQPRDLGPLQYEDASIVIRRIEGTTYYECSLPLKPMRDQIRPSEGREFCLGVLVHDPDGTGIRDLGAAAGLWPWERNRLAWSHWTGSAWPEQPTFDSKIPWGMCSSKY
jgi:hypothetical protein